MSNATDTGQAPGVPINPTNAMLDQFLQLLQRRHVLWELKLGIVTTGGSAIGQSDVNVLLDGDDNPLPCRTLIGPILASQIKVAVICVPPTGRYIIGLIGGQTLGPLGLVAGATVLNTGALAGPASAETDIPQLQLTLTWSPTRIYDIVVQVFLSSTLTTDTYNITVRRDTAVIGTQLATASGGGATAMVPSFRWLFQPTAVETVTLFFSFSRRAGTGTFSALGTPGGSPLNPARALSAVYDVGLNAGQLTVV